MDSLREKPRIINLSQNLLIPEYSSKNSMAHRPLNTLIYADALTLGGGLGGVSQQAVREPCRLAELEGWGEKTGGFLKAPLAEGETPGFCYISPGAPLSAVHFGITEL